SGIEFAHAGRRGRRRRRDRRQRRMAPVPARRPRAAAGARARAGEGQHRARDGWLSRAVRHRRQRATVVAFAREAAPVHRRHGRRSGLRPAGISLARAHRGPARRPPRRTGRAARGRAHGSLHADLRQIQEVNPYIRIDGLAGAAFCPTDGYIRPLDIHRGYLRGAQVRTSARVTGLRRRGSGIEAVQLADGSEIPAGAVVDAAGPWAGPVARLAAVDVPVAPLRRQVGSTVDTEVLPAAMPMTVWVEDAFHVRARDGRVLLVWPSPGDPRDPESTAVEQDWLEQ